MGVKLSNTEKPDFTILVYFCFSQILYKLSKSYFMGQDSLPQLWEVFKYVETGCTCLVPRQA